MSEETNWFKVNPVIIHPICIKLGVKQDCFNCQYQKNNVCKSPRARCIKPYPAHKKGCPNYGKKRLCPPNAPMFDDIFDMTKDIYCIYYAYNIKSHMDKMKLNHPNWTDRQLRNVLYWQGTAKKLHREKIKEFLKIFEPLGYEVASPEAMGIDIDKSLEGTKITLEWPPMNNSYRIAFAGIPKEGKTLKIYKKEKYNLLTSF